MFDPYGLNLPKYTFTAHCDEHLDLKLDDGATRIFLNCYGDRHKTTKALANLLDYILDGVVSDEYTNMIDREVIDFREDNGKERLFMTYQQTIMEERMFAMEEGEKKGILKMVLNMFKHNMTVEDIANVSELSVAQVQSILKNAAVAHYNNVLYMYI